MLDGSGLADLPGGLGVPVPELQTPLVAFELALRQGEGLAAGKVLRMASLRRGVGVRLSLPFA